MNINACLPRCAPQHEPTINAVFILFGGRTHTMKCCTHYSLRHPCIVPANLTLHSLTSAKQTGCVIGHRLVLTERIRRSYFSHDDFLAARSAAMIIESEGVMQVSVITAYTAQKNPCPRGIAHTERLGNSKVKFVLQRQCVVATKDSLGPAF